MTWSKPTVLALLLAVWQVAHARSSVLEDIHAKPYYDIDLHDSRTISTARAAALYSGDIVEEADEDVRYKYVHDGKRRLLCRIPVVARNTTVQGGGSDAGTATDDRAGLEKLRIEREQEVKNESSRATERGLELLRGMEGTCLYWIAGWWTYRFCYDDGITQFHALPPSPDRPLFPPAEDPSAGSFDLGSKRKTRVGDGNVPISAQRSFALSGGVATSGSKSLVVEYEGGTYCPITSSQRKTEVQFRCSPDTNDRIGLVKEVATCQYLMLIQTPRLCNDLAFTTQNDEKSHKVTCSPISDEPGLPEIEQTEDVIPAEPVLSETEISPETSETPMQGGTTDSAQDKAEDAILPAPEKPNEGSSEEVNSLGHTDSPDEALSDVAEAADVVTERSGDLPTDAADQSASTTEGRSEQEIHERQYVAMQDDLAARQARAAEELVDELAAKLDKGVLMLDGKRITRNEPFEYDFELQDEDGEMLGQAVISVIDGELVIELVEAFHPETGEETLVTLADEHRTYDHRGHVHDSKLDNRHENDESAETEEQRKERAAQALADAEKLKRIQTEERKKARANMPRQLRDSLQDFVGGHDEL
ncbi:Protein OS-9 [Savitreella phatthalungensis]